MSSFTAEEIGFTFLEKGCSVNDVIQEKIHELSERGDSDAFYAADLGEMVKNHLRWVRAMPRVKPFYAVKCNDSRPIIMMLALLGTGFDCASKHEIELMKSLGVEPSRIIYAHTIKQISHLKYAADYGVEMMTFDNVGELEKIATFHKSAKLVLRISIDNTDCVFKFHNKFGARLEECPMLLEAAKDLGLHVIGVSFHVGSLVSNPEAFKKAIADCRKVFDMAAKLGCKMNLVDIGGGFPGFDVPGLFVFQEIVDVINKALESHFPDLSVRVIAEPGRYYPTSSFTLVTNIIGKKVTMQDLKSHDVNEDDMDRIIYYVNDGIYTSFRLVKFHKACILPAPVKKYKPEGPTYPSTIFGQTCDGYDLIVEKYRLPVMEIGEWLLFYNMGAYSVTTASTFNGFQMLDIYYLISQEAWQHTLEISEQVAAEQAENGEKASDSEKFKDKAFNNASLHDLHKLIVPPRSIDHL